jgi:hypothetical protein
MIGFARTLFQQEGTSQDKSEYHILGSIETYTEVSVQQGRCEVTGRSDLHDLATVYHDYVLPDKTKKDSIRDILIGPGSI